MGGRSHHIKLFKRAGDIKVGVVRFSSGGWLTLCVSKMDANPKPSMLEITGTKGTYLMDLQGWKIISCRPDGSKVTEEGPNMPGADDRYYRNIAAHLTRGTRLAITPEWARKPVHILDLMDKSARTGKALKAKYA